MKKVFIILIVVILAFFLMHYKSEGIKEDNSDIILGDTNTPSLVTPHYSINHFIVADYILSSNGSDMTNTIQNTLNSCYNNGGGTVWLERGIYYVTKSIIIPTNCTLMGDYQNPDNYSGTLDYGTKIVVDVNNFIIDNADIERTGLFKMHSSSGIEGITIYYKGQNINNPKAQPWSIYYSTYNEDLEEPGKSPGMLFTIKNITLINSYLGIGRSTWEIIGAGMVMIENVKITALKKGVQIHNSGEVSTITGLTLKPIYWAKANLKAFNDNYSNPSESTIINKTRELTGIGFLVTDAELSEFVNVNISGYKYGIYMPKRSSISARSVGAGAFYNLNITNCNIGIFVDSDNVKSIISEGIGYVIANSTIEGNEYAIYIASPDMGGKRATIKLHDVSLKGKTGGDGGLIYYDGKSYSPVYNVAKGADVTGKINNTGKFNNLNLNYNLKNNGNNFAYLNAGSSVDTINSTLSSISSKGGGVVYLRPGYYNIDKTIDIPSNVELRGALSSSSFRAGKKNGYIDASKKTPKDGILTGTVFNVKNVSAIRMAGSNSGVFGIYFIYESNIKNLSSLKDYPYTFEIGNNTNAYVKNVTIVGATKGIHLNNSKNFTIQNLVTGVIYNTIKIENSSDGLILNCLQNGWTSDWNLLYYGSENLNNITRKNLAHLIIHSSKNIKIQNTFAYGSNVFLTTSNSSIYAVNLGYDGLDNVFINESNSTIVSINAFTYGDNMSKLNKISGGSVGIYNNYNMKTIGVNDVTSNINLNSVKPSINGDINGDNKVNAADYLLIRKHIMGESLSGDRLNRADVNKDGKVNTKDYIAIRKIIIGT